MVPPWADDQPDTPIPPSPSKRFQAFRTSFGKYLKGGDAGDLRKSLVHYAKTSTGGSAIGPRRFGSVYAAGGQFYDVLNSLATYGSASTERGLSRGSLTGQPLDVVCQRLADSLAPENGDRDRIRAAIDEAIFEILGEGDFDPARLDSETINRILCEYLSQSIFQEIVEEVGGSWASAPDERRIPEAEAELLEVIRVVVDKSLGPRLSEKVNMTQADVHHFMRDSVTDVWRAWENIDE